MLTNSIFFGNGATAARVEGLLQAPWGTLVAKKLLFQSNAAKTGLVGGMMLDTLNVCELSDIGFIGNSAIGYLHPVMAEDGTVSYYDEYIAAGALHMSDTSAIGEDLKFFGNKVLYNATLASSAVDGIGVAHSLLTGSRNRGNAIVLKKLTMMSSRQVNPAMPIPDVYVDVDNDSKLTLCAPTFLKAPNKQLVQLTVGTNWTVSPSYANEIRVCSPIAGSYLSAGNVTKPSAAACSAQCAAVKFPNRLCNVPAAAVLAAAVSTSSTEGIAAMGMPTASEISGAAIEGGAVVSGQDTSDLGDFAPTPIQWAVKMAPRLEP